MANEEQLSILKQGVQVWNEWRSWNRFTDVDLKQADLKGAAFGGADFHRANLWAADLSKANLSQADLRRAILSEARLMDTNISKADLSEANLRGADLTRANLFSSNLRDANLRETRCHIANLSHVDLTGARLIMTNLRGAKLNSANLTGANLNGAILLGTKVDRAKISSSSVYAVNVWDLEGEFAEQKDLIITDKRQPEITVDNIEVAQFIYLILHKEKIRDVINTLTSKAVLILGRFSIPKRKAILDRLRDKLREYNLLPIVFDFDRPIDRNITETVKTLAAISYFVIADVTSPKSSPLELQAIVPDFQIPVVPIIQENEFPFSMLADLQSQHAGVLAPLTYHSEETLIKALKAAVIDPAIEKHHELRLIKAQQNKIRKAEDFINDKGFDNLLNSAEGDVSGP